jgi:hypothetical protein
MVGFNPFLFERGKESPLFEEVFQMGRGEREV